MRASSTNFVLRGVLAALLVVSAAACRQADGPPPATETDTENRIGDLSRDLLAVAGGEAAASKDFADDLKAFTEAPPAMAAADSLAQRISEAIKGRKLSEDAAKSLARSSWAAVAAHQYSDRQVEQLQKDFQTQLAALSVPDPAVKAVIADVAATQMAVSRRSRRWYEVF